MKVSSKCFLKNFLCALIFALVKHMRIGNYRRLKPSAGNEYSSRPQLILGRVILRLCFFRFKICNKRKLFVMSSMNSPVWFTSLCSGSRFQRGIALNTFFQAENVLKNSWMVSIISISIRTVLVLILNRICACIRYQFSWYMRSDNCLDFFELGTLSWKMWRLLRQPWTI